MKKALIFAGTTEGRELAEALARAGVACDVCVATEYGSQVMRESELIRVRQGRLDADGVAALCETLRPDVVVDATHPYATAATETIRDALEGLAIPRLRLLRAATNAGDGAKLLASLQECADALRGTQGRIMLATGSKELAPFCDDPALRERLVVRVLPSLESLQKCFDAGLEGRQLVAMQGPFTRETNEALFRQYDVKFLVTKESGAVGGEDAKLDAARAVGVDVYLVRRPETPDDGLTAADVGRRLEEILGVKLTPEPLDVALVGVGCGAPALMTEEARARIEASDYLFGAKRMLESVGGRGAKIPVYRKEDVLPALEKIRAQRVGRTKVSVLFSGDPGFYSGCEQLYPALKAFDGATVRVLPGVSSVSTLAARFGIGWRDAAFMSLHGVARERWEPRLRTLARDEGKTFFIVSGVADVRDVGAILASIPDAESRFRLLLGRDLSYPDETLYDLTPSECATLSDEGLYVGAILNASPARRVLVPTLRDDDFIRADVPMTKEEIRKLAVCQLRLKPGDVLYDVGAGTGSVALQAAALSPEIRVFALERRDDAVALARRNAEKLGLANVVVLQTDAPDGLDALPKPDAVFIGGSGGRLDAILDWARTANPTARVVMTAVTLESAAAMNAALKRRPVSDLDVAQIAVNRLRTVGGYSMFQANNPVFLFSMTLKANDD